MTTLSIFQINEKLQALDIKIKALNFDNNGNPIDSEYANSLFDQEEELFSLLNSTK